MDDKCRSDEKPATMRRRRRSEKSAANACITNLKQRSRHVRAKYRVLIHFENVFCTIVLMAVAASVGGACFVSSVWFDFTLDDYSVVQTNQDVLSVSSTTTLPVVVGLSSSQFWSHDFWGRPIDSRASHKSYRPLTVLSLRLDRWMMEGRGENSEGERGSGCENVAETTEEKAAGAHFAVPQPFHLTNVLLYMVICALVPLTATRVLPSCSVWALAGGSLLFAVHPIHSEAVASIVGRAELLYTLLALLALVTFSFTVRPFTSCRLATTMLLVVAGVLCLCSALSKESGVAVAPLLVSFDLLSFLSRRSPVALNRGSISVLSSLLPTVTRAVFLGCVSMLYLCLRAHLCGSSTTPSPSFLDNPLVYAAPLPRAATAIIVQAYYVWLLVWPFRLSCDYGFDVIPVVETVFDIRLTVATILLVTLFGATIIIARRIPRDSRLFLLAAPCYGLPLLPASHVVNIGAVVAERLLFLPSIGVCFAVIGFFQWVVQQSDHSRRNALLCVTAIVVIVLAVSAHTSAAAWRNNETLFQQAVRHQPRSIKALLGHANHSNRAAAIVAHRRALAALPPGHQCVAIHGLSQLLLSDRSVHKGARGELNSLLTRAMKECRAFAYICDIGRMLAMENRLSDSRSAYYTCFHSDVHRVTALRNFSHVRNYAQVLYLMNELQEAHRFYIIALELVSKGQASPSQNDLNVLYIDLADIGRRLGS